MGEQEENPELDLRMELEAKRNYIEELENTIESYELALRDNKNEMEILETKLKNKADVILEYENNFVNVEDLRNLQQELDEKSTLIMELNEKLRIAQQDLENQCETEDIKDMVEISESKDNRISELEEALRESIKIVTERERVLQQEELKRKQIMEKVNKNCFV